MRQISAVCHDRSSRLQMDSRSLRKRGLIVHISGSVNPAYEKWPLYILLMENSAKNIIRKVFLSCLN